MTTGFRLWYFCPSLNVNCGLSTTCPYILLADAQGRRAAGQPFFGLEHGFEPSFGSKHFRLSPFRVFCASGYSPLTSRHSSRERREAQDSFMTGLGTGHRRRKASRTAYGR
jgi:hypothetical protein